MLAIIYKQTCTRCFLNTIQHYFHSGKIINFKYQLNYKKGDNNEQLDNLIEKYQNKLIYNSVINERIGNVNYKKGNKVLLKKLERQTRIVNFKKQCIQPLPVSLKYLNVQHVPDKPIEVPKETKVTHFPFENDSTTPLFPAGATNNEEICNELDNENVAIESAREVQKRHEVFSNSSYNWMKDYENYEEENLEDDWTGDEWKINYGTPDLNSLISNVPCGGCGALLHCKDTAIPGYIPSEIYKNSNIIGGVGLKSLICQRCHFLQNYNFALQTRVSPDDYPKVLSTIRNQRALIILMVDLLDFPCSIWPNIADILGTRRPIVVVGNKVDLLPRDSRGYLDQITQRLTESVEEVLGKQTFQNVKHVSLVSAKTGWGIEELITKIHNVWNIRGDVYLVGCTNVGKSTLFNCLLQSDLCKVQAVDLVQRATTSVWPGTTLNLLKFPILRPSGWRLYVRTKRLMSLRKLQVAERHLNKIQLKSTSNPKYATLMGHLDQTFKYQGEELPGKDPFSVRVNANKSGEVQLGIDESNPIFTESKWCYDTPGVVQPDQIIHLLTTEELTMTLPRELIKPRTFNVKVGQSFFIAGLGRIDYLNGPQAIKFTVFCANELPITMCDTEVATMLYQDLLGSDLLKVPTGSEERLSKWPNLHASNILELVGEDGYKSCGDIVLSNAGWVAITCDGNQKVSFKAWTPKGLGIYVRKSLLPFAVCLRGKSIRYTPTYTSDNFYIPK